MPCTYDVVWYWSGGTLGAWRPAFPGVWPDGLVPGGTPKYRTADDLAADLERAGYPTRRGTLAIGPPEGPPPPEAPDDSQRTGPAWA